MLIALLIDIALGGLAGYCAGRLMGTKASLLQNVILGIVGGFVGGLIMHLIGFRATRLWAQFAVAVGGSCLVLWAYNKYFKK